MDQATHIYETLSHIMSEIKKPLQVDAILWDFDGTLADSTAKNIAITKQILARVAPRLTGDNLPRSLQSEADYHIANHGADHWRDLYRVFFGMTNDEIETAGPLWETYQSLDNTDVTLFDGILDTVTRLSHLPLGICSANSTSNIRQVLSNHGIDSAFQSVIGYEDLPHHEQKPAPDGGLKCLQEIFGHTSGKTIIYVGDHIADVIFARGLGEQLGPSNTVISMVVTYSGAKPDQWREQPDEVIESPSDLATWIKE
jgi:phosphoglycolate phosphatase-like HAD superfamily hydrolase